MKQRMRALLHTEFNALLARAGVTQAGVARLAGLTPRQVNNWARRRAAVPKWAEAAKVPPAYLVECCRRAPCSSSPWTR
jgi:transcriptional regulator with XRE-family HTH domain